MILWLILAVSSLYCTHSISLSREDGSALAIYIDPPQKEAYPIVFLIPGSQKESALRLHEMIQSDLTAGGFCLVTLEKRGGESDPENSTLTERLADHVLFYENLKTTVSQWNGKIGIIGQGDGGRIGAHLGTKIKGLQAIVLISSGGAWTPLDETLYSLRSSLVNSSYTPQYIHGFLVQAKREFAQALESPKSELKAFGYSHKYWHSYLQMDMKKDLAQLNCPVYSIHGELDDWIPIESVHALAHFLSDHFVLIRKEKKGREVSQDPKTYKEATSHLAENF